MPGKVCDNELSAAAKQPPKIRVTTDQAAGFPAGLRSLKGMIVTPV
ncbi:Hypothetical protein ABZS17D1_01832 [Kosakonia cowanii]